MDPIDETILGQLSTDGRISFSELGRRVGLSTTATAARVRRLEASGIILGYRAVLAEDVPVTRGGLEAFIDVRLAEARDSEEFLGWTRTDKAISEAVHLTGPYDYLVRARVRDTGELDQFLRRLKQGAGAAQTQARIALRSLG